MKRKKERSGKFDKHDDFGLINEAISNTFDYYSFSSAGYCEKVHTSELTEKNGLWYKNSDTPFTGEVTGRLKGSFIDGKIHGGLLFFGEKNGQLILEIIFSMVSNMENSSFIMKMGN